MTTHKLYNAKTIEKQWQNKWEENNVYQASENSDKKIIMY